MSDITFKSATPALDRARFEARKVLRAIDRDAWNSEGEYAYVSADKMIDDCGKAGEEVGLLVSRTEYKISRDRSKTISTFEAVHVESGERRVHFAEFPIVVPDGRDFDKAFATSLTTAWTYWLRDFYFLSRRDKSDMDAREKVPMGMPPILELKTAPGVRWTGTDAQWEGVRSFLAGRGKRLTEAWAARLRRKLDGLLVVDVPAVLAAELDDMRKNSGVRRLPGRF